MNKKRKIFMRIGIFMFILFILFPTNIKAADSYTNAKIFYNTCSDDRYHIEFTDGESIYYATKAKTAASTAYKRYATLGWQITLTGGKSSVSIDVKNDGEYLKKIDEDYNSDGYCYVLYKLDYKKICDLASMKNPTAWEVIEQNSMITIGMDAIISWKNAGSTETAGYITRENGDGTVTFNDRSKVWYLGDTSDRAKALSTFTSRFEGYYALKKPVQNPTLTIEYYSDLPENLNTVTSTMGFSVSSSNNLISKTSITGNTTSSYDTKRFQFGKLMSPTADFGLKKTGYKIVEGKEWVTADTSLSYNTTTSYAGIDLYSSMASVQNPVKRLYANWQPIEYHICYHGNGGIGNNPETKVTYNKSVSLLSNPFYKEGYVFTGWNTKMDGSGTTYQPGQVVKNLTALDGENIRLYAQWEPRVYTITVDDRDNTGGTSVFYQKYDTGFALDSSATNMVTSLTIPTAKKGYTYKGLFLSPTSSADPITDASGKILVENNYFLNDTKVYTQWEANKYWIYFDKGDGINGTDKVQVTFDKELPNTLVPPYLKGYSFGGYYTEPNGQGERYFNEFMNSDTIYQIDSDITLYAYWVDKELPTGRIYMPTDWTNRENGISIEAVAKDDGNGLSRVYLYLEAESGDVLVASAEDLNGAKTATLNATHDVEGVYRYRLEIWDTEMDLSQPGVIVYKNAKYDITPPTGTVIQDQTNVTDLTSIDIMINVTDFIIQ